MASPALQNRLTEVLLSSTRSSRKACPDCGSHRSSRSQRFGILERYVLRVMQVCPYRCIVCYKRFYRREA